MQVAVLTQRCATLAQDKQDVELKLEAVSCELSDLRKSLHARLLKSEEAASRAQDLLASERLHCQDRLVSV